MKHCRGSLALAICLIASAMPAFAQSGTTSSGGMTMPMSPPSGGNTMSMPMNEGPANFAPTREAYTTNHRYLVKLLALPSPIPFEKYFDLRFAVYDAKHPTEAIRDAQFKVIAGMRHGQKQGFAHGMQSAPKVKDHDGVFTVSGMYFHMMGPWTLEATVVRQGKEQGMAYFQLPCCT